MEFESHVHGCMQVNQDIQTIASGKYVDDRPEGARSPSPAPIYNENGIRVNSRDQRAKEKLQKQRYVSATSAVASVALCVCQTQYL